MSFWGAALGGIAGGMLGGPLGAVLGAALGYSFGHRAGEVLTDGKPDPQVSQLAFVTALIVLGAKMAKADGRVTDEEVAVFRTTFAEVLRDSDIDMDEVASIFNQARTDAAGFEPYARQIAAMVSKPVLEQLLRALLSIALADGELHPKELRYLRQVADLFGFHQAAFERLVGAARGTGGGAADPWQVLGLSPSVSDSELKTAYRRLARENHPDRLIAEGLPETMIDRANAKMAAINRAYDQICKMRGL